MRRIFLTIAILGLSFILAAPSFAQSDEEVDPDRIVNTEMERSHHKFKRGFINLFTFPLEVPKQTKIEVEKGDNIPERVALLVPGMIKGIGFGVVRLTSGLWDIVTFSNMFYEENEPLLKPEYVWDDAEE